jgi:uncharacterized protein YjbI with pentapeptide repeats
MTPDRNVPSSGSPNRSAPNPPPLHDLVPADEFATSDPSGLKSQAAEAISRVDSQDPFAARSPALSWSKLRQIKVVNPILGWIITLAIGLMVVGISIGNFWIGFAGSLVALVISLRVIWVAIREAILELLSPQQRLLSVSIIAAIAAAIGLLQITGALGRLAVWYVGLNWDAIGATGEVIGAVGQILIAILAVYVAWRQYVIGKDLTIQQNVITQQQTIDSYFQGISDLVLDEEGLLEDMPLERAIAAGRTAAILSSVDANGKAKVLRFLSRSRLLTPLKRDRRLGRAILDGLGGYAEDRKAGTRVIDLGVMLAGSDLSKTDLRWSDLSDINLIYANLSGCDLVKANFARTILCEANLAESDMMGTRLFYGPVETATPRTRADLPDYNTGAFTGAVVEDADFTEVKRMSDEQRYYCCAWGGSATRATIPDGCEGIPNLLGR